MGEKREKTNQGMGPRRGEGAGKSHLFPGLRRVRQRCSEDKREELSSAWNKKGFD